MTGVATRRLGRYLLEERVGHGAVGELWRAREGDRTVALRVLSPRLAADDRFRGRFLAQSRRVARLRNPHVLPVHAVDEVAGRVLVATRWVHGRDLAAVLADEGPLPPRRAVALVEQVASALSAAHACGITHGDLKPSAVLVDDVARLAGFGVAGSGSLRRAAPERFRGAGTDHRVDVYSLGCLFFECLTGRLPFGARDPGELMHAHVHTPPPRVPGQLAGAAALSGIVATALAKDPAERFPTAGALARACRRAVGEAPR